MKKIAGKIAMILILVMLANSFAGCSVILPQIFGEDARSLGTGIDIVILVVAGLAALLAVTIFVEAEPPNETGIYLASSEHNLLTEYYSAMEILNSLPEAERVAVMEKINSLSAEKHDSLVRIIASLPQAEIAAYIEKLNALSEAELVSTVQGFNALSEAELDVLADRLNERVRSLAEADHVALAAVSP